MDSHRLDRRLEWRGIIVEWTVIVLSNCYGADRKFLRARNGFCTEEYAYMLNELTIAKAHQIG